MGGILAVRPSELSVGESKDLVLSVCVLYAWHLLCMLVLAQELG